MIDKGGRPATSAIAWLAGGSEGRVAFTVETAPDAVGSEVFAKVIREALVDLLENDLDRAQRAHFAVVEPMDPAERIRYLNVVCSLLGRTDGLTRAPFCAPAQRIKRSPAPPVCCSSLGACVRAVGLVCVCV